MKTAFLQVPKTARYVQSSEITNNTQEVWIVLHGYGQLATDFIEPFLSIASEQRVVIAPEGLNKFYAKGLFGKPAATWMTSEEREHEIADYIEYLNRLYLHLQLHEFTGDIVLLGFSQGTATASRWLNATTFKINKFILYAGEIAAELKNPVSPKLLNIPIVYVTGDKDPLINEAKKVEINTLMQSINATQIVFNGVHEVTAEVLKELVA